jgi:hypothetical protein
LSVAFCLRRHFKYTEKRSILANESPIMVPPTITAVLYFFGFDCPVPSFVSLDVAGTGIWLDKLGAADTNSTVSWTMLWFGRKAEGEGEGELNGWTVEYVID